MGHSSHDGLGTGGSPPTDQQDQAAGQRDGRGYAEAPILTGQDAASNPGCLLLEAPWCHVEENVGSPGVATLLAARRPTHDRLGAGTDIGSRAAGGGPVGRTDKRGPLNVEHDKSRGHNKPAAF